MDRAQCKAYFKLAEKGILKKVLEFRIQRPLKNVKVMLGR
jgi:hypothetical protein